MRYLGGGVCTPECQDELYHYGVKGMRWHMHLYANGQSLSGATVSANLKDLEEDIQIDEDRLRELKFEADTAATPEERNSRRAEANKLEKQIKSKKKVLAQYEKVYKDVGAIKMPDDISHSDITVSELKHHGVMGMKWGVRRYQPYSVVPRGSGKTGKEIGDAKKSVKSTTKKFTSSRPINEYNLPQNSADPSLHRQLYDNDPVYKQNYDEAAPLRKKYEDAVSREVDQEQKVLNGDFGFTNEDGTNPKSLDDAYDKWDRLCTETLDAYEDVQNKYMEIFDHMSSVISVDKNSSSSKAESTNFASTQSYFDSTFAKGNREKYLNEISRFPEKQTNPISTMKSQMHRRKQKEFEAFLKDIPVSEKYKELQNEYAKQSKAMSKAENDLVNKRGDSAAGQKAYDKAYAASEKALRGMESEACRMLGVDESKIDSLAKTYLTEMIQGHVQHSEIEETMNASIFDIPVNELYHHGISGMKWGDRNGPPYPLRAGAKSAAEKRAARAEKKAAKFEKKRQKILKGGNAQKVLKNSKYFSNDEIQQAVRRLELEKRLSDLQGPKHSAGKAVASAIFKGIKSSAEKGAAKKQAKQEAKEAKERSKQYAKERKEVEKLVRTGSKRQILKNIDKLNNKDLQDAYNRLEWEAKIKYLDSKEFKKGKATMDRLLGQNGIMGSLADYTGTTAKALTNYNKIVKALNNRDYTGGGKEGGKEGGK